MFYLISLAHDGYTAREVSEDNTWDFITSKKPEGVLYLVRVHGRDGDSEGSHPSTWDVEVFHDLAQAEALADKIDFTYDLAQCVRDRGFYSIIESVPQERRDSITELYKLYEAMTGQEKGRYQSQRIDQIEYEFEDQTLRTRTAWQGVFESMNYVEVIELHPKTEARWRKRW